MNKVGIVSTSATIKNKLYENAFSKNNIWYVTPNEFQQAKNSLATAESEMIKAKYTYVFRLKVLNFYQGKPLKLE